MKKKKMKKWIPKNTEYCYEFLSPIIENCHIRGYNIKPCPWYKFHDEDIRECRYLGFKGFDACLYDQCKICDKHRPKELI